MEYTAQKTAQLLNVSPMTVSRWRKSGRLDAVLIDHKGQRGRRRGQEYRYSAGSVRALQARLARTWSLAVMDCFDFLDTLKAGSVDLILTDPPYGISRETGFQQGGETRLGVSMDFGEWDKTNINLGKFCRRAYKTIRKGGSIVVFYDLWKISYLAEALTAAGFSKLRFLEWVKTNPVPLNSKRTYLSNAREVAISAVKGSNPTFNSEYDNGVYTHAITSKKDRFHPTQKPLLIFKELIRKHSHPTDLIIDPYAGSGTTAVAAISEGRRFAGCDMDAEYIAKANERIKNAYQTDQFLF